MVTSESRDITGFLYETGLLKRYPRTGWLLAGVPAPESVAEHSFRASVTASVIAVMEGADNQRAAFLALWHDSQETRTTDLPHLTKRYVTATAVSRSPASRSAASRRPSRWLDPPSRPRLKLGRCAFEHRAQNPGRRPRGLLPGDRPRAAG